ncbi:D-alanyl-D-alanine carboxypeptidase/D-alanyl-D-alanine-endopeptidase [Neolewinella aurantiaca]|uniref:D-alanyl-D-alanine carboxypeptidase/D-alanyl-D-alanine-endopeptidase n=1 Tax=Neolewinella aurantiaca TaxID=2602767 RepID=A0A5C7FNM0_9BACT|nr:D-alanyl-D-alanine carboxypeptidase/D-alanyl-D-alanine-endopeptidase [Neolewinella aurantiaca]TXF89166.1 D-alanyl-D-alanine carboxypeptidase/D-alanyl-D-alanine-endopeptidase [Neolewinella aurantiaca]
MPQLLLILLFSILNLSLAAQVSVQDHIRNFAQDPDLAGAVISISVIDTETGRMVGGHQSQLTCIPASTQKLLTTAVAMDVLGEDHRFTTKLLVVGTIEDGTLNGDIHIVGGGDPSLGSPYLDGVPGLNKMMDRWRSAITSAGIRKVNGRVIGDGSYFGTDGPAGGWPWSDIGNYYGAGAYGLNIHENFYFLDFLQRGRVGDIPPIQRTRPEVPGLKLTNELRSGPRGSGDQAYIFGAPFGYDNFIRGTIPVGTGRFTIKGAIPDPALFTAQLLCRELKEAGVSVSLPAESNRTIGDTDLAKGQVIDTYISPPLSEIVDRTNLRSNNLYAEVLLREISKARGVETHELSSTKVVKDWLAAAGLPVGAVRLEDGSGLATRNFFSAEFMTSFLRHRRGELRWRASIPLAGRTGSMRGYLKGTVAEGRLRAKSGSLGAVRAYAGYADRKDGSQLAFAIMVNNFTIESRDLRNKMHLLMLEICRAQL